MQGDFQRWWNERYFHTTHPFYNTFKKLHRLGADVDYVDFLCDMLRGGDYFQLLRPKPKVHRKHELFDKLLRSRGDEFVLFLRFFATMAVGFAAEVIARKHVPDKVPLDLLSTQEVKAIVRRTFLFWASWGYDNAVKKAESSQAQKRETSENFESEHGHIPIIRLFLAYNKPIVPKRGNRADPWGTLFLLAVTEHLREGIGKPHYGDAVRLLEKTRLEYLSKFQRRPGRVRKTNAQSALVRVQNFKKANPSWQESLGLFKDQFRLSALSQKQARS